MPFKSEAQRKWMHANRPEMAKEWEKDTPSSLPDRIKKTKKPKKSTPPKLPKGGYHQ